MNKSVLITGGFGFLGKAAASKFKLCGYNVFGIGNGRWDSHEFNSHGFDGWLDATVSMSSLASLNQKFDVIVHCAGNGSVGYSLTNPLQDFKKTVDGTAELLEYVRLSNSAARLVYPSSAGVYGSKPDVPIKETDPLNPISPYGYHKRAAEELCESYARTYGLNVSIIRFFSIYGPGLTKQLLWDASNKLLSSQDEVVFWGTGEETRDWIYIDDATELIIRAAQISETVNIINGASGIRVTVRDTIELMRDALGSQATIAFNNIVKEGDPRFYNADTSATQKWGFISKTPLAEGIQKYASWYKDYHHG